MQFVIDHSYLIPLLPLIGALIAGLLGKKMLKGQSHLPIWAGVGASAVMSLTLLVGMLSHHGDAGEGAKHGQYYISHWFDWIIVGDASTGVFNASMGAFLDPLTAVMLSVVCGIGFLITVFAAGYMKGEAGYFRFFAYLGLFIFAMTLLVMGDNLIVLYLGWEGVGLCSYLLIGYHYDKPAAREAAKKAFIVNRIGDFGFAVGILLCFYCFGTVSFFGDGVGTNTGLIEKALHGTAASGTEWAIVLIPFALMLGAFGKSAQFPLYVWLPDAMEGPTPVSALIHAATMVTAGIYMIARCSTLFVGNSAAMITIAFVGAFTALFAGLIAMRQNDLKKVFAYSTVSQLGFMFVAAAVLSPVAAVFHLITHAFFKALLFLSSGVVMHATGGELDLRKMSGLKKQLPKTRLLILIGCLALSGFPLLAGFWSKDEIIHYAAHSSTILQIILLATALLTAYYTFRLYFRVFEGPELMPHGISGHGHDVVAHGAIGHDAGHAHVDAEEKATDAHHAHGHHNHEPMLMMLPLLILAIGALFAGVINLPFNIGTGAHALGHFLEQSPSFDMGYQKAAQAYGADAVDPTGFGKPATDGEFNVIPLVVGGAVALLGIGIAYVLHLQSRSKADEIAGKMAPVAHGLDRKLWIDELYQNAIVEPLRFVGRLLWIIDRYVIDGIVFMVGFAPQLGGFGLKLSTQRGYLQGYAVCMLLGLAAMLIWMVL